MITRKTFIAWLACLAVALCCANVSRAQDKDPANDELATIYAKQEKLILEKDTKALASYLSDDYTADDPDGKTLKRAEAISSMEESFSRLENITAAKLKITDIKQVEGNYIVDVTATITASIAGPDGKDHEIVVVVQSRDWWVKMDDGAWKTVHSEEKGSTVSVDGKPVGE